MVDKNNGVSFTVYCDFCALETLDTDTDDFSEAIERAKQEGWKFSKDSAGQWEHRCPGCQDSGLDFECV